MYIALARTVSKLLSAVLTGYILPPYTKGIWGGIMGARIPNLLGALVCFICFLSGVALCIMDKISD
jgi:hypothetical protein